MNISILLHFYAVVKFDLNFTIAAKKLGISQPAITKSIKNLEDKLGVCLFVKKGRKCHQLTQAGVDILPQIKHIIDGVATLLHTTPSDKMLDKWILISNLDRRALANSILTCQNSTPPSLCIK